MVDEPKPKNTGRRRISDLNKTLTVKEKKAKKSAQEKLADKKKELVSAKRSSGASGKYKRSSKTNVSGARKKGATLRDWFEKEDWRRVDDPSKKCGE